ncbi:unnamed protein product [Lymnaea stagnalis]|uniref:TNFR-Cys domain-containing protein n=1 Tax=Lymnaea stagnalis TaxID=6523 RepID=A0AAV2II09_LYMST
MSPAAMLSSKTLTVAILVSLSFVFIPSCCGRTLDDAGGEAAEDDHWPVLCAPNTYYSKAVESCVVCSECPVNTIITSPCHRFQDTKCGPFYDFNAILEAGREHSEGDSQEEGGDEEGLSPDDGGVVATTRSSLINKSGQPAVGDAVGVEWRSVAVKLSLIITGFVLTLAVIIVGGVCYIRRKYINGAKSGGVVCEYSPAPGATPVQEC